MWRTRAVITMLIEDIACLKVTDAPEHSEDSPTIEDLTSVLQRAMTRARWMVALDVVALLILFVFRDLSTPFLPGHRSLDFVFTLGVLAVAAHAGFRAAQLWTLRNVHRLCEDLRQRDDS